MFRLIGMLLRGAQCVFFNTQFQMNVWQPVYGLDASKLHVLENWYPAHDERGASVRPHVFVSAARSSRFKNMKFLERVFSQLQKEYPDIVLDTRIVPHAEQLERLRKAYAVIIPSVSEIGSNTAIEAVSVGTPFIMTEDTGTKERLSKCGIFIDTRSEERLKEALERLLDPEVYKTFSENARTFSFVRTWDEISDDIMRVMPSTVSFDNTRSRR